MVESLAVIATMAEIGARFTMLVVVRATYLGGRPCRRGLDDVKKCLKGDDGVGIRQGRLR